MRNTTSNFGIQGATENSDSRGDFFIAWECPRDCQAEGLKLNFAKGTTVAFNGWTNAAAWKAWGTYTYSFTIKILSD